MITGIGVVSSIGSGVADFLDGLRTGRCGAAPISSFDTAGFAHATACEAPDFDPAEVLERVDAKQAGRVAALAAAAARMAVIDARLPLASACAEPGVVAVGTTCGESWEVDRLAEAELHSVTGELPPECARLIQSGRLAATAATELGLSDVETLTIPTVCAAGNYALGYGLDAIRAGDAEFALCGGADAVNRMAFAGFYRMGALASDRCRPFDTDREGVMWGEGAAMLVLESLQHARRRGAAPYAEVLGVVLNCDAEHPTAPFQERVAQCLAGALAETAVPPADIDAVFAHATGTAVNDPLESAALAEVFGPRAIPPVIGIKSMIGHTMGAAATHACVAAILAMRHGFLPPTVGLRTLDPQCPVDCVPNTARDADVATVLVNSMGLGGNNAAAVLRRWEGRWET